MTELEGERDRKKALIDELINFTIGLQDRIAELEKPVPVDREEFAKIAFRGWARPNTKIDFTLDLTGDQRLGWATVAQAVITAYEEARRGL